MPNRPCRRFVQVGEIVGHQQYSSPHSGHQSVFSAHSKHGHEQFSVGLISIVPPQGQISPSSISRYGSVLIVGPFIRKFQNNAPCPLGAAGVGLVIFGLGAGSGATFGAGVALIFGTTLGGERTGAAGRGSVESRCSAQYHVPSFTSRRLTPIPNPASKAPHTVQSLWRISAPEDFSLK